MLTQSQIDHLTDIAESMIAISSSLHRSLIDGFSSLEEYDSNGAPREDLLGQALALNVLAKDLDLSLLD